MPPICPLRQMSPICVTTSFGDGVDGSRDGWSRIGGTSDFRHITFADNVQSVFVPSIGSYEICTCPSFKTQMAVRIYEDSSPIDMAAL